jgi:hypothetical protein
MALFCLALPLAWIAHKLPLPYSSRLAAIILAAVSLIAGAVLSRWTMAEDRFLRKPVLIPNLPRASSSDDSRPRVSATKFCSCALLDH